MQLQLFKGTISKDSQKNSITLGQIGKIFRSGKISTEMFNQHNMDFFIKETSEQFRLIKLTGYSLLTGIPDFLGGDYVLLEGDKVAFYAFPTKRGFYNVIALRNFTRNYTKKASIFFICLYGLVISCIFSFIITVIFGVATKADDFSIFIVFIICFMIIFFPFAKECKTNKRINTTLLNMQESSLNE